MKSKKGLGQNFLKNEDFARELVEAVHSTPEDTIVEVGPGRGMITKILLEKVKKVLAVEKDGELVEFLKKEFSQEIKNEKLVLIHDDILNFEPRHWKLEIGNWKLIGAIPYYITGAFLRRFLQGTRNNAEQTQKSAEKTVPQPNTIALIIQKEVAERVCAKKTKPFDSARGKESMLSISVKAYGTPHYIKTVPAENFTPVPGVDSAIMIIENISKKFFENLLTSDVSRLEEDFFNLVKTGFSSKRKKLTTNLKRISGKNPKVLLREININENIRAEDLTLEEWKKLYVKIYSDRRGKN